MMQKRIQIAPSILSADFARLAEDIHKVEASADIIHVDVMDGHFVPNITIGPCVVKALRKCSTLPLDVHLMISDPEKYLEAFADAGSDWITFHLEAVSSPEKLIRRAKALGVKVGISIKPATGIDKLLPLLPLLDLILIMSVEPGFGGQAFMSKVLDKVRKLKQKSDCPLISIDGGINEKTAPLATEAGVDILVAGSAVFKANDPVAAIQQLRDRGNGVQK